MHVDSSEPPHRSSRYVLLEISTEWLATAFYYYYSYSSMCHQFVRGQTKYAICGHLTDVQVHLGQCSNAACSTSSFHPAECMIGALQSCRVCSNHGRACSVHHLCRPIIEMSESAEHYVLASCTACQGIRGNGS